MHRLTLLFALLLAPLAHAAPPNVVLFYVDDMGYADLGCYGAKGYTTPNIDRLASEGVRFTDFYVAQAVCSASRAALLTGCYSNRVGILGALGPNSKIGIDADETTLAEVCKSRGYATAAYGKWHLGCQTKFLPTHHGFAEYCGIPYSNDMWPFHPDYVDLPPDSEKRKRGYPDLPLFEGDRIANPQITGADQAQFTTTFAERAVDFIRRHKGGPFFVYIAHPMPHVPLFVSDKFAGKTERGLFGDVVSEIDWSVGLVVDTLEDLGLTDNTLVIFTSDNGPWISYGDHAGSAGPLREAKGTSWDGGVRVPCVMRWPGHVPAGREIHEPAMTIDILPTIAGLIGADLPDPASHPIDGLDIWPVITRGAPSPHEALYIYWNRHLQAVRSGRWSLHFPHPYRTLNGRPGGTGGRPVPYEQAKTGLVLYDLDADVGQLHDVAAEHPEVVARLEALADKARADLGDSATETEGAGVREPGRVD
ncbi:MAG: sulfatase [Phycisphaeraceae bacterium]|nr:MAG: sulfatase [Phycisphaeraceae bacterium]